MSLPSRLKVCFQDVAQKFPAFQTIRRSIDFEEKGKAEQNVYYRKEQARLLDKLRKAIESAKRLANLGGKSKDVKANKDKE